MEFPSEDWGFADIAEYETAILDATEPLEMDLLAQIRPTGRILDNFRLVLGGTAPLRATVDLGAAIPGRTFEGYRLGLQQWPRDIRIRQNMLSSAWLSIRGLTGSNDAAVTDPEGEAVGADEYARMVQDLNEAGPESAAIRWAVCAGGDRRPVLQLQSLPATANYLNGRAAFRG